MLQNHIFIVIGMEHYNPLGVIRSLGRCGIKPVYIAIKHKCPVASCSKYASRVHYANDVKEAYDILVSEYGGKASNKPFVITTDDDIESLLDEHYEELNDKFIFFNSGRSGRTTYYMDKKAILDLANKHGLNTLNTVVVKNGELPQGVNYPIITKAISPNDGGWKSDVHICESETELTRAFEDILSPIVLVQEFVEKKNEVCVEGFSINRGKDAFHPVYTTYNYNIKGYYSPYMTVHEPVPSEIQDGVDAMLAEIGFEGIYEIEFLLDRNDNLFFSEINFRNSTWSYVLTKLGMPLPLLWAQAMLLGEIPQDWTKSVPFGYTAMVEPIDYQKRVVEGDTTQAQWLSDFKNADCLFYHDNEDAAPFEVLLDNWKLLS